MDVKLWHTFSRLKGSANSRPILILILRFSNEASSINSPVGVTISSQQQGGCPVIVDNATCSKPPFIVNAIKAKRENSSQLMLKPIF